MHIEAIVLGFLAALLGFSVSVKAQAPLELPDLSEPEPSVEEVETPDAAEEERETEAIEDRSIEDGNIEDEDLEDETDAPVEDSSELENAPNREAGEGEVESVEGEEPIDEATDEEAIDVSLPDFPEDCEPLPLVNGEGYEVTKRTSPPSFTIPLPLPGPIPDPQVRSNWNTDWYIPNAQAYRRYRVILLPHSDGRYSIQMFFKYPDETSEQFYEDQEIRLTANEPLIIDAEPRSDLPPYQINTNIGGILSIGVRYTIAVAGCREASEE